MAYDPLPAGYRLEWRPGDYCFYTPDGWARERARTSARVHGLFRQPQPGCGAEPAVYLGRYWVQPKNLRSGECPVGFVPLYLGPVLHDPAEAA